MAVLIRKHEERPYNLCLHCTHIGRNCDGPNFLAMETDRLCEWCRLRKELLHNDDPKWTNAYIAEQAGIAKVTVDRFLSGASVDLKSSTISRILRVLVNGSWGQYPCAMDEWAVEDIRRLEREIEKRAAENERLEDDIAMLRNEYRVDTTLAERRLEMLNHTVAVQEEQLREKDRQMRDRADFLRRKDRVIRAMTVTLAVLSVLVVILAIR